jgi:hypothetical protein
MHLKMNRNIFYAAFILGILAVCISSNNLSDRSTEDNSSSEKRLSLMNFLQTILDDPEYMALSDREQLAMLEVIYSLLESSYNQRKKTTQHHGINGFLNLNNN